jgi:hypothetical protein
MGGEEITMTEDDVDDVEMTELIAREGVPEKLRGINKTKMRNLKQYKNLTDDEFDDKYAKKMVGIVVNREFEKLIQKKITEFGEDYELTDLNSNDKMMLRALAQAMVNLDIYESEASMIRAEGVDVTNIELLEKLSRVISSQRTDISRMQDDLNISRKQRKPDKETSALDYLENLKLKAKEFYEARMAYIFCDQCHMLLGTFWTLYPEDDRNKITLICNRILETGEKCGNKVVVTTKELLKNQQTNNANIPESLR